jgi:LytS/YehU family sensor histidine kinase
VLLFYPIIGQFLLALPGNPFFGETFNTDPFDGENAAAAIAILLCTLPFILTIQWFRQNNQISELEKHRSKAELELLKSQINPHFFFNTLNNLYALCLTKSDETPEMILKLSDLMRYVIYKGNQKTVPVSDEVAYIEDYVSLQMIREKNKVDFSFSKEINQEVEIPPLLFIVPVENAFKHGIEKAESAGFLKMELKTESNRIHFSCKNSFNPAMISGPNGIGLENLKRRLELIYPEKHKMEYGPDKDIFSLSIIIDLQ